MEIDKRTLDLNQEYIGCDEVGVGDYFGPLVACAAYLPAKNYEAVKMLGVNDSKLLSDKIMLKMMSELEKLVDYSVSFFSPKKYNELNKKYQNTHLLKTLLHNNNIKNLRAKISDPKIKVIMDQYVTDKNYYAYLQTAQVEAQKVDLFVTKAESKYLVVAVASIIARVKWIQKMNELSQAINMMLPYGAVDEKVLPAANKIVQKYGKEKLIELAKIDFKTTKKITGF